MENNIMKFAARLKELREEQELSQAKLAKELGVTQAAIDLWERNKRVPSLESVIVIAKFFNVSLDYLAGIEN